VNLSADWQTDTKEEEAQIGTSGQFDSFQIKSEAKIETIKQSDRASLKSTYPESILSNCGLWC
jgi:hypothetical protein